MNVRRFLEAFREPAPLERGGTVAFGDLYPGAPRPNAAYPLPRPRTARSVAASTSPVTLADPFPARRSLVIVNDSSADLYVLEGAGASIVSYTAKLGPSATLILEPPDTYAGLVSGVWSAVNGAARLTEL